MKLASFPLPRALSLVPAALSLVLLSSPRAHAQEAEVNVTAPAAAPPPAAVVVTPAPSPRVAEERSRAAERENEEKEEKDTAHFRFGLGLDVDYLLIAGTPSVQGFGAGLQLRLGAQINQWFATYYQAHAVLGGTLSDAGLNSDATVIGAVFNSVLLEATLPVLHVGAGPSVDVIGYKGFSLAGGETGATNANFGVEGRAAIVIGGHGPGRHAGFAINANVHPTFWNGLVLTTFSLGIGGEMY